MNASARISESERREVPPTGASLERLVRIPGTAFAGLVRSHLEQSAPLAERTPYRTGLSDVRIGNTGSLPAVNGPNESFDWGNFERARVAEALFLSRTWMGRGGVETVVARTGAAR